MFTLLHLILKPYMYVFVAYYYSSGTKLSWDDAYEDCKARDMELAIIDSQSELDAAILYIRSQS